MHRWASTPAPGVLIGLTHTLEDCTMLWSASTFNNYAIAAIDGRLGAIKDWLFDDVSWSVRWLVVDSGRWLSDRKVLLPPSVLGRIDEKLREISTTLTARQVKDSPPTDTNWPVSRQMETDIYDYYGWMPYWSNTALTSPDGGADGGLAAPPLPGLRLGHQGSKSRREHGDDPHLRSTEFVTGYRIQASDGEIGHVADFLLGETDWRIRYLVVDTKNWWPGKKVLISPRSATKIDWTDKLVYLDLDRQKVKDSPPYDSSTLADAAFEKELQDYYDHGGA
jgi:hypothetical protein